MVWLLPLALWLLPLVGIPFLLLWRTPPLKRRIVSALYLWRPVVRSTDARPASRRLRVDSLTLVRAALLLTIIAALARPALTHRPDDVALIVDLSPELAGHDGSGTSLDAVRQLVIRETNRLPAGARLHLFTAGHAPTDLGRFGSTGDDLRRALTSMKPVQGRRALTETLDLAWAGAPRRGIVVSTRTVPAGLPSSLTWQTVGGHGPNVALTGLFLRAPVDGELEAIATVANQSPSPATVRLTIMASAEGVTADTLHLEAGEHRTVTRTWRSDATTIRAELSAEADTFPSDNVRVAARSVEPPVRVRLVQAGNAFLKEALLAQPQVKVTEASTADADSSADEADIIVCDRCPAESPSAAVFRVTLSTDTPQAPAMVTVVQPSHPLARDLTSLALRASVTPPTVRNDETVVLTAGGVPVLTASETGGHRRASLFVDLRSLDLPLSPAFPVLVGNVIDWLSGRTERPVTIEAGSSLNWHVTGSRLRSPFVVENAAGRPLSSSFTNGQLVSAPLQEPGIYHVRSASGTVDVACQAPLEADGSPWNWAPPVDSRRSPRELTAAVLLLALVLAVLEWRLSPGRRSHRWPRLATCLVLALAAADAPLPTGRAALNVMFVLDQSDSVWVRAQRQAVADAQQMSQRMRSGDGAGAVVFGQSAALTQPVAQGPFSGEAAVRVPGGGSDIAAALRTARLALPIAGERRMVLLSDGKQTGGSAREEAALAAAAGISIDVAPTGQPEQRPAVIRSVRTPAEVRAGEPFLATVTVEGRPGSKVQVATGMNDEPAREQQITLDATGLGELASSFRRSASGLYTVLARIGEDGDPGAGATVQVTGPPTALYVSRVVEGPVLRALREAGVQVDVTPVARAPETASGLTPYDLVVLDDISAAVLGEARLSALSTYIEREGGGLLVLGSATTLEAPAFAGTPLASLLPLDFRPRPGSRAPSAGFVVVFDKSGSMADRAGGIPRIELAREAALRVLGVLPPGDGFGVIAFDARPTALVPLGQTRDEAFLRSALAKVTPSGATSAGPAVELAARWLRDARVDRRHVLLVSDGRTSAGDLDLMSRAATESRTELSIIAIGADASREALVRLASSTGGHAYFPEDLHSLPDLAARDAVRSRGGVSVEEHFVAEAPVAHPVLRGLALSQLPALDGYVVSTLRPGATGLLMSHLGDPVLALAQSGLGRTAVYTADLRSRWSSGLRRWPEAGAFWAQLTRWLARPGSDSALSLVVVEEPGGLLMSVSTETGRPAFRDGQLRAEAYTPQGATLHVPLRPVGDGRFEGHLAVTVPGTYPVTVSATDAVSGSTIRRRGGVYISGTAERLGGGPDLALLQSVASLTGGRMLSSGDSPYDAQRPFGFSRHRSWLITAGLLLSLWTMTGLVLPSLPRLIPVRTSP